MARVTITLPDELVEQARAAGLTISTWAAADLRDRLSDLTRQAQLVRYLDALDAESGAPSNEEQTAAEAWLDAADVPWPEADTQVWHECANVYAPPRIN